MDTGAPLHDLSSGPAVLEQVAGVARRALAHYDRSPAAALHLLHLSENATFRVDDPETGPSVLRVHRLGYHRRRAIESELAWMEALRTEAGVRTPGVVRASDGATVVSMRDPGTASVRHCVMFDLLAGSPPGEADASYEELGALTARMHHHARSWRRPAGFTRFTWDTGSAFGPAPRWGRWQDGVGVGRAELEVLGRLERTIRDRLDAFGTGPERFGLIHADTRRANLLDDGGPLCILDFDDCGFGWHLYDLGTSFSFFEHEPHVPQLVERWLAGYRTVGDLPADDEREVWTFILLRRLLLVAWIGSHRAVDIARRSGGAYTERSCALAEDYLSRLGRPS